MICEILKHYRNLFLYLSLSLSFLSGLSLPCPNGNHRPIITQRLCVREGECAWKEGQLRVRAIQSQDNPPSHPLFFFACLCVWMECDSQTREPGQGRDSVCVCVCSDCGVPIMCGRFIQGGGSERHKRFSFSPSTVQVHSCAFHGTTKKKCLSIPTALCRNTPPSRTRASL